MSSSRITPIISSRPFGRRIIGSTATPFTCAPGRARLTDITPAGAPITVYRYRGPSAYPARFLRLLLPGQQISRKDALRLYTAANAWFNFEENDMGTIEAGKFADLVVLDKPYFTVSDEELKRMQPLLTMVGGHVVHARAPFAGLAK